MAYLLRLEWMKVKNYRTFWILIGLFAISMLGINYINWEIKQQIAESGDMVTKAAGNFIFGDYMFPAVFKTVTQMSSWLLYFPGFIMIFHTTNEFTYKTHRQNIIDGLSRQQFIVSKLLFAFVLVILCTLLVAITALTFGIVSGGGPITIEGLAYLGYFFMQSSIYILFAFILAILLRRAALAVGIFFIYGLIFDFLLAAWISKYTSNALGFYLMPLQVADEMNPVMEQLKKMAVETNQNIALLICAVWVVFYCIFPLKKYEREDL